MQRPRVSPPVGAVYSVFHGPYSTHEKFIPNGGWIFIEGTMDRLEDPLGPVPSWFCGMCGNRKHHLTSLWCTPCRYALARECCLCKSNENEKDLVRVPGFQRACKECAALKPECACCDSKNIVDDTGGQHMWAINTDRGDLLDLCQRHLWIPECYVCGHEIDTPREMCYYFPLSVLHPRLRHKRLIKVRCRQCYDATV